MCICIHLVWDILLFICGLNAFCLCAYLHFSMQPQEILGIGVPLTGHTMFLYAMMMSLHQMNQFFRSATNSYEIFLFCLCACIISKCNTRCLCGTVTHNVLVYNVKVNAMHLLHQHHISSMYPQPTNMRYFVILLSLCEQKSFCFVCIWVGFIISTRDPSNNTTQHNTMAFSVLLILFYWVEYFGG